MITIALCTRNRPQHLKAWINHLDHIFDSEQHAIIIIDQSDVPYVHIWQPHITYIHSQTRGIAHARNLALATCVTPYILFTDDDCRPAQDWLQSAHRCIIDNPTVSLWFGQALPSGNDYTLHQHATHAGQLTWAERTDGAVCHALQNAHQPFHVSQPVAILEMLGHGNQMLMQCAHARHIGNFNPWLGVGAWIPSGEDVDFAMRLLVHGYQCAYTPTLRIIHDAWMMPAAFAQIDQRNTTGMIAIHMLHAWQGNTVAIAFLYAQLHHIVATLFRTTPPTNTTLPRRWRHILAMVHGFIGGICLIGQSLWPRSR